MQIKQQIQFHEGFYPNLREWVSIFWSSFLLSKGAGCMLGCSSMFASNSTYRQQSGVRGRTEWKIKSCGFSFFLHHRRRRHRFDFRFLVRSRSVLSISFEVHGMAFSSRQCSWAAMVRDIHPCVSMRGAVVPLLCALSAIAALPVLTPLNSAWSFDLSYGYYH